MLYSEVPRSSQCPSISSRKPLFFFSWSATPDRIGLASSRMNDLSKSKWMSPNGGGFPGGPPPPRLQLAALPQGLQASTVRRRSRSGPLSPLRRGQLQARSISPPAFSRIPGRTASSPRELPYPTSRPFLCCSFFSPLVKFIEQPRPEHIVFFFEDHRLSSRRPCR